MENRVNDYTVLFVDDEPYILKSLQRLFRGDPFKVLTSSNAGEALEVLKSTSVQVLVTDNMMPGMTGVELAKRVKELYPKVLRIILSGQSNMDAVLKAVNEGEAFRFVLKPWSDMDLKATINIALAQYKLIDDNQRLLQELNAKSHLLNLLRNRHPELFLDLPPDRPYDLDCDEHTPQTTEGVTKETLSCPKP